ncbi:MAG: CheB methylesterase domain-containing protein [Polyangiales bacterium]
MAQVKLVRRWASTPPYQAPPAVAAVRTSGSGVVVGIAASTGGPNALRKVLADLPPEFDLPILVVQHIASGFAEGLATWLSSATGRSVVLALHGDPLMPGVCYVAPDDKHLGVASGKIVLSDSPPVEGFRPSATYMFGSLARSAGPSAIGVILTGMGSDGVAGLRELKEQGGSVIVQDEATSDVWGMPGAAMRAGLATSGTALDEIAARIVRTTAERRPA